MTSSLTVAAAAFAVGALAALGASYVLVTRLERVADRLRLTEAALGLLVALAADSPEIASAVSASAHGQRSVGAGVVLGSNVFNLAALLGLGSIVAGGIGLHRRVVLLDGAVATWVALVSVLVVTTGLTAVAGTALVLLVVIPYVVVSAARAGTLKRLGLPVLAVKWLRRAVEEEEAELAAAIGPAPPGRFDALVILATLVIVVGASIVMERSAERLGKHLGLSSLVIGGVVLAAVTSLPNAVGAIFLAARGRGAAVLSEAMNSNMFNVVVGLLLPGIVIGLNSPSRSGTLVVVWYCLLTVVGLALAYARSGLSRRDGALIVAGYVGFVLVATLS